MPKQFSYDEILKVKHAFLTDGEKSYFLELLNDPKQRNIHFLLRDLNPYILFEKAQELIDRVEAGEFDEQQMAVAEYKIVHYLAAIGESEEKIQELYILQSKTDLTKVKNKQEADNQIKEQLKKQEARIKDFEKYVEMAIKSNEKECERRLRLLQDNKEQREF